jgi:hypothetical protein
MKTNEPKIHSHIDDVLPDEHPLAFTCVDCVVCGVMVHASNNECMQTWIETGKGAYCLKHFAERKDDFGDSTVLSGALALPDREA